MLQIIKHRLITVITVIMIISLALFAPPVTAQAASAFTDIDHHWARDAIVRWEGLGVLQDFPIGRFYPDAPVTRAEFFAILTRALGATERADISRFTDVWPDAWYYDTVAIAHQMRIANGVSESAMNPEANIIRQDAATLVARAFGFSNETTNFLSLYQDGYNVSDYAQGYVSALTEYGYMRGSYGNFYPRSNLSRAEAVKIIDNLFTYFYYPEAGFNNITLNGNVLSSSADSVFNSLTLNGDLILGDGVGEGNAALNDCVINGRLVIRGGGPDSVVLNNSQIRDGIVVFSPSVMPRVVTVGTTVVPRLTAFSGFILSGTGVHEVKIAADAMPNANITLSGVQLDSLEVEGLAARVEVTEGRIARVHFAGDAADADFILSKDAVIDYLSTVAPNTIVSGNGQVGDVFINAPGARISMSPQTYTLGVNLTATIAGQTVTGQMLSTGNSVERNSYTLAVRQNSGRVGGEGVIINSAQGRSSNAVLVTQKAVSAIPLDSVDERYGYFIGFFIPAPPSAGRDNIQLLTYSASDGSLTAMRQLRLTRQDGMDGLEFFIPVTRDGGLYRGRLNETMYIQWNDQLSENLVFHSGWLDLERLSNSQESRLVEEFWQSRFYGLDGTLYSGGEALKRLLTSDNPLGLDVKGFAAFTDTDQDDLAERLIEYSAFFNSKQGVQERLDQILGFKGALYAINNAVTVWQIRNTLEHAAFAKELNISISEGSAYGGLSERGKERVARQVLAGRTKEYANAAAVKAAFDKAVAETKNIEVTLLAAINAAKTPAEIQKLIETKVNADLLGLDTAMDPYKRYNSAIRLELANIIKQAAPHFSVDDVARIIEDFLATMDPGTFDPKDDTDIISVKVEPVAITMLLGETAKFSYTITTPSGLLIDDWEEVTVTSSNTNVAEAAEGMIAAKAAGSARISVTSVKDTKKSAVINVTVKIPVPATGLTLNLSQIEVEEEQTSTLLKATMTPSNTTDTLTWTMSDPSKATVSGISGGVARITGVAPGFTTITARTSSNQTASALVIVVSKEPGVMVYPQEATVGIGQSATLQAVVSPISLGAANRRVRWVSADTTLATVDSYGKVTGVAEGAVEITAISIYDPQLKDSATITVDGSVRQMSLNTKKIVMSPTGFEDLTAKLTPPQGADDVIKWDVRAAVPGGPAEEIATVNANGRVTAVTPGKVYVFAYLESDSSVMAECEVEVLSANLSIGVANRVTVAVGDDLTTAAPSFNPNAITNKKIDWSINHSDIASFTVNSNGSLTISGLSSGVAVISGKPQAKPDMVLAITVTVTRVEVRSFTLSHDHIFLYVNESGVLTDPDDPRMLRVNVLPTNATDKTITWSSDTPGLVSINNMPGDESNPFGPSTITAVRTTFVEEVSNNPDGTTTTRSVDRPVRLVATASNGNQRTVLVTVYEQVTSQLKNLKILVDRWVYPVGGQQNLSVLFNITGRTADGEWQVGTQPPNRSIVWSSNHPDIAYVTNTNALVALKPGIVRVTATAVDGGAYDTVSLVIGKYGITEMNFTGLAATAGYGRHLQMYVGESKNVSAALQPAASVNEPVVWLPYRWAYDNEDENDTAGAAGALSYDMVRIISAPPTPPPWSRVVLTAQKPGLVQVKVIPTDEEGILNLDTMGTLSLEELEALCATPAEFAAYLDKNDIVADAGNYYTRNERNLTGFSPAITPRPLSLTMPMPLVIPNDVINNDFFIWITGRPLESVIFSTPVGASIAPEQTVRLIAELSPLDVNIENPATDIVWSVSDGSKLQIVAGSANYNAASGECDAEFMALAGADPGAVNVTVTVSSATELGLKSPGMSPRQKQDGVTHSASYTLTISGLMAAAAAGAALPSLQIAPALSAEQPLPEAPQPFIRKYGYIPAPNELLLPASGSKALKLRSSATVVIGGTLNLIPLLSPGNYDLAGLVWATAKPDIATVDGHGVVTGVKAGKTTVSVSIPGTKLKANCSVTVAAAPKIPLSGFTLNNSALTLEAGKSAALKASFNPTNASLKGVSWVSSNSAVATVDSAGKVNAIAAGSATITAITDNGGYVAGCAVTITPKPVKVSGVKLSRTSLTMQVGEDFPLTYTISPQNATNQNITWSSSNNNIVTVAEGRLTAIKKGNATVTITTEDGKKKAACKVTVK